MSYAPNYVHTFDFVPRKINGVFGADNMTRMNYIYSRLPITHSLIFWLPETAWLCQLVTHSSIYVTWMRIYSTTFFFPILPFWLDLFQSRTRPQTFHQILKETNDQRGRKFSSINTRTQTEEYLTSYIRKFVMFCNVSFLCTCWDKNLFLFVLLCFECSFVRVLYIVCFAIMSQHKLWEPNI